MEGESTVEKKEKAGYRKAYRFHITLIIGQKSPSGRRESMGGTKEVLKKGKSARIFPRAFRVFTNAKLTRMTKQGKGHSYGLDFHPPNRGVGVLSGSSAMGDSKKKRKKGYGLSLLYHRRDLRVNREDTMQGEKGVFLLLSRPGFPVGKSRPRSKKPESVPQMRPVKRGH